MRQDSWEARDRSDVHWQWHRDLRWDSYKCRGHVLPLSPVSSTLNIPTFTLLCRAFSIFRLFPKAAAKIQLSVSLGVKHLQNLSLSWHYEIRKWYIRLHSLQLYTSFKTFHLLLFFFLSFFSQSLHNIWKTREGNHFVTLNTYLKLSFWVHRIHALC